jgi:hypothetical protein
MLPLYSCERHRRAFSRSATGSASWRGIVDSFGAARPFRMAAVAPLDEVAAVRVSDRPLLGVECRSMSMAAKCRRAATGPTPGTRAPWRIAQRLIIFHSTCGRRSRCLSCLPPISATHRALGTRSVPTRQATQPSGEPLWPNVRPSRRPRALSVMCALCDKLPR